MDCKVKNFNHYDLIAGLFDYPDRDYPDRVNKIKKYLDANYPIAAEELGHFLEYLPADNLLTMQELFTRSFDVQAITTLDIGYVLFGDDYKRGELLANLNREHNEANNDCGTELADHLPNVLRLFSKLKDEAIIEDLAYAIIAPALTEMISEFSEKRIEKKNENYIKHYKTLIDVPPVADVQAVTFYQYVLKTLYEVLKQDFTLIQTMPLKKFTSSFLGSIKVENEIEDNANA